ncbi:hypothetical protein Dsin_006954 [Dipteronia sinensis]|uniref:Reverse transcriptase domain-containing protein n=1 Tax=Dipteronia sinensis TaxID=43782 RepID=A0AAE0EGN3_9ROSI|nr:hypothetical protein Dsin_006954 [Dipteronia sinensis]
MRCVTLVSFSFLINGEVCGSLKPSRGLRQGDPLSPYMFLICAEGLSSLIRIAVSCGDITGYWCGSTGPLILHLIFADDSLFFANTDEKNCRAIKHILGDYALASGQEVNFSKSALCTSKSVFRAQRMRLANIVGVNLVRYHEKYLGLLSFASRNKKQLLENLKERVWSKISGWKHKLFLAGGKEVLIKEVIQSIPSYAMNLFCLPKGLISDIHRFYSRFLWGNTDVDRKLHWGSWEKLCEGKNNGRLRFRDLSLFNQVMLAKQCWSITKWPNSLVARVLKGRYFPTTDFLNAGRCSDGSFVWRRLLWGRELHEEGSKWPVGAHSSISIYRDR